MKTKKRSSYHQSQTRAPKAKVRFTLHVSLSPDEKKTLVELSKLNKLSASDIIRALLAESKGRKI